MSNFIWDDLKRCPRCRRFYDQQGFCDCTGPLDLAKAWRISCRPIGKITPEELRKERIYFLGRRYARGDQPVEAIIRSECLVCGYSFAGGVCSFCGLSRGQNSPQEIFLMYLGGKLDEKGT